MSWAFKGAGVSFEDIVSKDSEVGSGDQVSGRSSDGLHGPDPWPVALVWL